MNKNRHPYGTTLLARDTAANRKVWKPHEIGEIDIDPKILCDSSNPHRQCPPYTDTHDALEPEIGHTPIHLLIASFRDRLCPRTLHNVFRRAKYPDRIYVRILLQNKAGSTLVDDADCWERYCQEYNPTNCAEYRHQVHTVHVDASQAKGPTDARSKLSAMIHYDYVFHETPDFQPVQPLDFCLQTDSHMDFSDEYDVKLIQMWHRCHNNYAVLSTYVADIE
jgi:Glycosyltransferase (GlcNAc)